jgi:integrase
MISKRGTRWRVVVQNGRDPITQRRLQLSASAATKAEARKVERELMRRAVARAAPDLTVRQLVAEWWASNPRLAATTKSNYRGNLESHVLPVIGDRRISEIRPRLVSSFLQFLDHDRHLSPGTIRKVRTVLSSVMSYAVAMEYVESNPVMKVPPPELPDSSRIAPTVAETAAIMLASEIHDPAFLTYLWVAAEEGGRRGETLALRWGGVDFDTGIIDIDSTVTRGDDGVHVRPRTKNKKSRRVAISDLTLDRLREHRRRIEAILTEAAGQPITVGDRDLVFSGGTGSRRTPTDGLPWRPDSTSRRFSRVKELAGVRPEIDLHGLRHTMITELLMAGVDPRTVMGRAGHSSEAMTMLVYAKVRPAADAAAAEMWGQMLGAKMDDLRGQAVTG